MDNMPIRNQIFISHATPQDNEFSIWIASRLEMLGYKVWVDKNGLLGGERFWPTIQKAIDTSIKILFVYSKNIITSEGILKPGIENEIEYAKSVAYENNLKDFIIPLHIDDSKFHLAIGMPNINHVPFDQNWADGLRKLLRKLEKDGVPKDPGAAQSSFSEWYENEYSSYITMKNRARLYYSSWWGFKSLPKEFYIIRYHTEEQAKKVRNLNPDIPVNLQNNVITTFEHDLICSYEDPDDIFDTLKKILPEDRYICDIEDLYYPEAFGSEFPTYRDTLNAFKRLMLSVWNSFLKKNCLRKYTLSGKRQAYFRPKYDDRVRKITFQYPFSNGKKKKKAVMGTYKSQMWHYAMSANVLIDPQICFLIKSHIIFTSDGQNAIDDEKKMHSFRRDKGKRMFNEEWRDLLLAMIQSLTDEEGRITLKISYNNDCIELKPWPETFWSDLDYRDPKGQMGVENISDYIESEEPFEDEDNE